jgi:hypothetical protein
MTGTTSGGRILLELSTHECGGKEKYPWSPD